MCKISETEKRAIFDNSIHCLSGSGQIREIPGDVRLLRQQYCRDFEHRTRALSEDDRWFLGELSQ